MPTSPLSLDAARVSKSAIAVAASNPSTMHDNSVALYLDGTLFALAAERADRIKHSMDAGPAFAHMRAFFAESLARCDFVSLEAEPYAPHTTLDHHLAHAYGAFMGSPFEEAAILVTDGMGPAETQMLFSSVSLWHGRANSVSLIARTLEPYPCCNSLGNFSAAINYYLGFDFFDACYAMSIAAYGNRERYKAAVDELVRYDPERLVTTNGDFIKFATAFRFPDSFGQLLQERQRQPLLEQFTRHLGPPRAANEPLLQRHYDLAAAAQWRLEEVLASLLRRLHAHTNCGNLCYTGGVALNCKANAAVLPTSPFSACYIPPAPDDTGQSVGRLYHRLVHDFEFEPPRFASAFMGPHYGHRYVAEALTKFGRFVTSQQLPSDRLVAAAATLVANGGVVGWYRGRSEFGPRALGHRSILADPRNPESRAHISERFKLREFFRPFAPSILAQDCSEYFAMPGESCRSGTEFMQYALRATDKGASLLPATIHVDGTARLQAVSSEHGLYYELLRSLRLLTGVGAVVNTSFNAPGMPLIETPEHAVEAFVNSRLDALFLEDWIVTRKET